MSVTARSASDCPAADLRAACTLPGPPALSDAVLPETELADTELADTELADTELADTELADTELADTELADTELAGIAPASGSGAAAGPFGPSRLDSRMLKPGRSLFPRPPTALAVDM
jgi:hypothetical protein